jgi:CheY-like chemotaxis protein
VTPAVPIAQQRATILCVEDEPCLLELRKLQFDRAGYVVLAAETAEAALEIFATHAVDLVFADYLLPGMNGVELAKRLKQINPHVRIVLTSGTGLCPEHAPEIDLFIAKPEDPVEMISAIAALLRPRARYGT